MDRMNLRLLVVIVATTAVLGIMTSSITTGIFSHANAIMWGLAHCWHNPNVGLICTQGHSGQGGHPHPILEKLRQAGGMKNATAAGANMTRNAK
jgi:hypothetical protein